MVAGSECICGRVVAPPRLVCPECRGHMNIIEISKRGTLLSFTSVCVPPEGFEPGFILGMIELERGTKLLCEGFGLSHEGLKIGMVVDVARKGDKYYFAPVLDI